VIIYSPPRAATSIPVVDFSGSFSPHLEDRKSIAWEIHKACRETGFFYIANHRVPRNLIESQFDHAQRFFALPLERKLALHMSKSPSAAGYEPIEGQILASQDDSAEKAPPDLKESFYCAMELPDDHPWARKRIRSFGHNQWPVDLPGFKEQMLAYHGAMRQLGDRVLAMLALSLDLPEGHFAALYGMPGAMLRLLRYPPHSHATATNQLGAGAHTDWGGITLLAQDNLGGLEVRNVDGEWIQAKPIPDTFVINLGDLMQRWTNDIYRSNMHRVRNNSASRERYSIPFFYSPGPDSMIECLPTCTDPEHPPKYPPCTASQHISEMFRRSYGHSIRLAQAASQRH
jgi:isopenicillin N synthase-like dioxygenase